MRPDRAGVRAPEQHGQKQTIRRAVLGGLSGIKGPISAHGVRSIERVAYQLWERLFAAHEMVSNLLNWAPEGRCKWVAGKVNGRGTTA